MPEQLTLTPAQYFIGILLLLAAGIAIGMVFSRSALRSWAQARLETRKVDLQLLEHLAQYDAALAAPAPAEPVEAELVTGRHLAADPDQAPAVARRTVRQSAAAAVTWIRQRPAAIRSHRDSAWKPGELAAIASGGVPEQRGPRHLRREHTIVRIVAPRTCLP